MSTQANGDILQLIVTDRHVGRIRWQCGGQRASSQNQFTSAQETTSTDWQMQSVSRLSIQQDLARGRHRSGWLKLMAPPSASTHLLVALAGWLATYVHGRLAGLASLAIALGQLSRLVSQPRMGHGKSNGRICVINNNEM